MEGRRRHSQSLTIIEVLHVHSEGAVFLQIEQVFGDQVRVKRLSVRGKPHQFVFARVDLESTEVRKGRVEQSQRVRKVQLVRKLDLVPVTGAKTSGGLLAYAIKRENRRLIEG